MQNEACKAVCKVKNNFFFAMQGVGKRVNKCFLAKIFISCTIKGSYRKIIIFIQKQGVISIISQNILLI